MARQRQPHPDYVTCKHCRRDFRAITVRHLRNVHGYEGDHPVNDYKRKFRLLSATCPDVRKKISEAKDAFWARRGQHWKPDAVLAAIRRLHERGRSLRRGRVPVRLYEAGRRYFRTWQQAIERAGVDYAEATGHRQWTRAKVVEAIRRLARPGVRLSAQYAEAHHPALFNAAVRLFPRSWSKALRAAGLEPWEHRTPRGRWDRSRAEAWVRKRAAKGKPPLARHAPRDLLRFVYRRLHTTWPAFVESLGIAYAGMKKRRDWTRSKLLEEIRRWDAEGHRLNYRAVKAEYQALIHQARKFFKSWDRARAAAGV